jgi:hypothetical protein
MKWGGKYGADYVNRLYAMVARHLRRPFHMLCLTDDARGVRPEVGIGPLPALPALNQPKERGWNKLGAFSPEVAELMSETVLFLDLDVVITGPLDPLFEHAGAFPMIRDWYHPASVIGNSSVFRFRPADHPTLFADFCAGADSFVREHRNEQEFLTRYMQLKGALAWWPADWCQSYRVGCLPLWPMRAWATPKLPETARVVVFHGDPKPHEAIEGRSGVFKTWRPAPWVAEHWAAV